MTTDNNQVIEELARVTNSSCFRSRKQMRNFLSYIVTEKLNGRGRYLKQYTIAVYGLGKSEDFSPGENPLIRVEAGRLRHLLADFYEGEGKNSSVKIELPKGCYQPQFTHNQLTTNKRFSDPGKISKRYSNGLNVLLGFKCFTPTPDNLNVYYLIVRDFTLIIKKFPFVKVLSASPNNSATLAAHDYITYIRTQFSADFLLKMDVECLDEKLNLKCLLMHTTTEEIVWGESFDIEKCRHEKDLTAIYQQIANDLFAPDNGVAHQYQVRHLQAQDKIEEDKQRLALIYLHNTYTGFTQEALPDALQFCKHYLADHPQDIVVIAVNLHLYLQEYFSGRQITADLNAQYHTLVNTALRINSGNAETYLFHAFSAYLQEDFDLALGEIKHALTLNPHSAFNQFFAGSLYYVLGEFTQGDSCLAQAIKMGKNPPDWYHIMTGLSAYRRGNQHTALTEAKKVYIPWGSTLRAFLYKNMYQQETTKHELPHVIEHQPKGPTLAGAWITPTILAKNAVLNTLLTDLSNT